MSSMSMSNNSRRSNKKVKTPMEIRPKPTDVKEEYDAFFPIYSDEECKKFCSLLKRNLSMPKHFDDQLLKEIHMFEYVNFLCKRMG